MRRPISAGFCELARQSRRHPRSGRLRKPAAGGVLHRRALGGVPPGTRDRSVPRPRPSASPASSDIRSNTYRSAASRAAPSARCLLTPAFVVCEGVAGASEEEETEILGLRLLRRRATKAWKSFKLSAVSSFTYVETAGLLFAGKILGDSAGLDPPCPGPEHRRLSPRRHRPRRTAPRAADCRQHA